MSVMASNAAGALSNAYQGSQNTSAFEDGVAQFENSAHVLIYVAAPTAIAAGARALASEFPRLQ